ncbi:MAG TPA: hypothetical protein VHO03_06230 [Ignavibacteriales bacterium]|nr:hypothetical protein [Ignavibacteriales bacterium]
MNRKLFALFLYTTLFLNGCLNYYQETTVKTDGSGNMFVHYWMKNGTSQDSLFVHQVGIFNADSIKSEFSSNYTNIDKIEVYADSSDTTIHAKVEFTFQQLDSLNNIKAFREANFSIKNGAAGQKIFSQFVPPVATGFGVDASSFTATYVYYLPGDIITHNAQEISKNRLTWRYKLSEIGMGKTLTATYRPFKLKETPVWIYSLAFAVLLIVIIFLFRKNKS